MITSLNKTLDNLKVLTDSLPQSSGCYQFSDIRGNILYIGKAKNIKKRVISYSNFSKLTNRLQRMVSQISNIDYTLTASDSEALLLEANLIKARKPKYNILLRDDKSMPMIKINRSHDFPKIESYRGERFVENDYFGPFASTVAVRETLISLQKLFKLRSCSDFEFKNRKRPCIKYQIKRCSAPCCGLIDKALYNESINEARNFLLGKSRNFQTALAHDMNEAALNLQYEKAANLRDKLQAFQKIQAKQLINYRSIKNCDIIVVLLKDRQALINHTIIRNGRNLGSRMIEPKRIEDLTTENILSAYLASFYSKYAPVKEIIVNILPQNYREIIIALSERLGSNVKIHIPKAADRKKILNFALDEAKNKLDRNLNLKKQNKIYFKRLRALLDIRNQLTRIEIFDNSHLFGSDAVSAMIVASVDGFERSLYRKFKIKLTESNKSIAGDDLKMMAQVIERRISRALSGDNKFSELPQLMLIDGGYTHAKIVAEALKKNHLEYIKVLGIAKGLKRNAGDETFYLPDKRSFKLDEDDPLLFFLQNLRDEAHRSAITFHRKKKIKMIHQSALDNIQGIGSIRKRALLNWFGSVENIKNASLEEIVKVNGISKIIAKEIYGHFRS